MVYIGAITELSCMHQTGRNNSKLLANEVKFPKD